MNDTRTGRNRVAVMDAVIWVPMIVLVALDLRDQLPDIGGLPLPTSAITTMLIATGALVAFRRLRPHLDRRLAECSVFSLWTVLILNALVLIGVALVTAFSER